jgi:hypothetical protein
MRAAKEMVAKVETQGGSDNTSVIIISLNQVIPVLSHLSSLISPHTALQEQHPGRKRWAPPIAAQDVQLSVLEQSVHRIAVPQPKLH